MGALAGHVAWEHRVTAVRDHDVSGTLVELDSCPLTAYAGRLGAKTASLDPAWRPEHRGDWERLAAIVTR